MDHLICTLVCTSLLSNFSIVHMIMNKRDLSFFVHIMEILEGLTQILLFTESISSDKVNSYIISRVEFNA